MVSSFGVAQVSHICKLALEGKEVKACEELESGERHCCSSMDSSEESESEEPCCTNTIKYFQNKMVTVIHQFFTIQDINVAEVFLFFNINQFNLVVTESHVEFFTEVPPDRNVGRFILISKQTFLI